MNEFAEKRQMDYENKEILDEIVKKINLLDFLENIYGIEFIEQPNGEYRTRCPFPDHDDSTPSFDVNKEKGLFICRGCGAGGTIIGFVMKMEKISLEQAVNKISELYNISSDVEYNSNYGNYIKKINNVVNDYFNMFQQNIFPAGISDYQFMNMLSQTMREYIISINKNPQEIEWAESMYKKIDYCFYNKQYKKLINLWDRLPSILQKRKIKTKE